MAHGNDSRLREVGLRVTQPRVAVLDAVAAQPHSDTETIHGLARAVLPAVSKQAIYDVLDALTAAGLLRRIQPAGHVARYETRVADNHHHLVCRACGLIVDVDCVTGRPPCLEPPQGSGFLLDEAEVTYWGLCPRCAGGAPAGTRASTDLIAARDQNMNTSNGKDKA